MAFTGYYLYRGIGGRQDVDFDTPVASISGAAASYSLVGAGHAANTRYTYALRPVLNDLECPDVSCWATFETDGDADWVGSRPDSVIALNAVIGASGAITLYWEYRTGSTAIADFGVYYSTSPGITIGSPQATVTWTADGQYSKALSLSGGTTYWLGVTGRTAGGVESKLIELGPFVADSTGPETPTLLTATTFGT